MLAVMAWLPGVSGQTVAPPSMAPPTKPNPRSGQRDANARKTVFDNPVVMYTDTDQNRLTIRTSPRTWTVVEALLKQLDLPTRQVLIRAIISEITLNKNTEFGFSYAASRQWDNLKTTFAGVNTAAPFSSSDLLTLAKPPGDAGGAAFLFQNANSAQPLAFVRAVAGETNVKVISAPQIVAANDEQAVINVGNKVPIITQDYTTTSSSGSTNRSYQYTDTGIILTVTPHITAGNEVRLDITQEASDASKDAALSDQIIIKNRKLETKLVVPDGGTVLMGGLISTNDTTSHTGIPWLKDIPALGRLFRTNATVNNRTELLVIVTVNVLNPESDINTVASRFQETLKSIRDKLGQY
jgi:general secretion pathway protein D